MNRTIKWIVCVLIAGSTACSEKSSTTLQVSGSLANAASLSQQYPGVITPDNKISLQLYEIPADGNQPPLQLDSIAVPVTATSYTLKGKGEGSGIYVLAVANGPDMPFINDASKITADLDFKKGLHFYSVKGSDATTELHKFMLIYDDKRMTAIAAFNNADSLKKAGAADSLVASAEQRQLSAIKDLNNYMKQTIGQATNPTVAAFVLGRSAQALSRDEFMAALDRLVQKFPEDKYIADIKKRMTLALKQQQQRDGGSWVGKKAPELVLPDTDGKDISLTSFKGKYVLVDFWASWCGPCRAENPNVVAAYNQFKNKNFTILGVSLDKNKDKWLQAIQQDQLSWTHVSDLAYWNSKAVTTFNFNGIPFNVLIDPQGTIIAESLRGDALQSKLQEVLH